MKHFDKAVLNFEKKIHNYKACLLTNLTYMLNIIHVTINKKMLQ